VMKHALDDNKPPVVFHFQLVNDFLTVDEIAQQMLQELAWAVSFDALAASPRPLCLSRSRSTTFELARNR
jgi:hypothetical protein